MAADRTPDWHIWLNTPNVSIWEAAALSLNIEPSKINHNSHGWMVGSRLFNESEEFKKRITLISRNVGSALSSTDWSGSYPEDSMIDLKQFAFWALSIGLKVPDQLSNAASNYSPKESGTDVIALAESKKTSDPMNKKERNSLLSIVGALLQILNWDADEPSTAGRAKTRFQNLGLDFHEDTLRDKFREAKAVLEDRKKR